MTQVAHMYFELFTVYFFLYQNFIQVFFSAVHFYVPITFYNEHYTLKLN